MTGPVIKDEYPILKQLVEKWEMEASIYEEISERKKAEGDEISASWFDARAAELNSRIIELIRMKEIVTQGEMKPIYTDEVEKLVDEIIAKVGNKL